MKLFDLYADPSAWVLPYALLSEREPEQNISHRAMPTWDEHRDFVLSRPYPRWYSFDSQDGHPAGCAYLTARREVGIGVLKRFRGQGLASAAIDELMRLHPGRFLANIAPANAASIALFRKLGFGGPIQVTLEKP